MAWVVLWLSFPPVHCTAQLHSMVTRQREKTNIRSGVAGYGKAVAACCAGLQNRDLHCHGPPGMMMKNPKEDCKNTCLLQTRMFCVEIVEFYTFTA